MPFCMILRGRKNRKETLRPKPQLTVNFCSQNSANSSFCTFELTGFEDKKSSCQRRFWCEKSRFDFLLPSKTTQDGITTTLSTFCSVSMILAGLIEQSKQFADLMIRNRAVRGDFSVGEDRFDFSCPVGALRMVLQPLWTLPEQFWRFWLD